MLNGVTYPPGNINGYGTIIDLYATQPISLGLSCDVGFMEPFRSLSIRSRHWDERATPQFNKCNFCVSCLSHPTHHCSPHSRAPEYQSSLVQICGIPYLTGRFMSYHAACAEPYELSSPNSASHHFTELSIYHSHIRIARCVIRGNKHPSHSLLLSSVSDANFTTANPAHLVYIRQSSI